MIRKLLEILFKDGWLTAKGRWTFSVIGWTLVVLPLWLAHQKIINGHVAFMLFSVGIALAQVVNYEAKSKQFSYQPPFTADPLGWRRAKESYRLEQESDAR
jgi:hypothetical protein